MNYVISAMHFNDTHFLNLNELIIEEKIELIIYHSLIKSLNKTLLLKIKRNHMVIYFNWPNGT